MKIQRSIIIKALFAGLFLAAFAVAITLAPEGLTRSVSVLALATLGIPLLGTVGVLDDEKFQKTVAAGMEAQKSATDKLVAEYDRLDGATKKAFEDLTLLKKAANDSQANFTATQRAIERIDAALKREARMAFGDPIKRITADPEHVLRINAAVRRAVDRNGDLSERWLKAQDPELVKRALGEDSSPGSTLIQSGLLNEIYDLLATYGVWNTFAVRRMGTKLTAIPVKTARPVAQYILTEGSGQIADDTNKAGSTSNLEVEVIAVLLDVSLQLLQDAEFDVTADVMADFAEAYAYRLDWSALQADGTADATDGGMTGAFAGGTAAGAAAGNTTVEATDLEDWTRALLTVGAGVLTRPCRWWLHPQMLIRALSVKDGNGRPIFLTANEAPTPGGIGSILGYPVTPAHAAPSTNSASGKVAVFGDPSALVVGIRSDYAFEASDHHKWDYLQRSFRAYGRAGVKIRAATGLSVLTLAAN